ncbi:MAG TPA: MarC family protein [Burkholderiales bacterium]
MLGLFLDIFIILFVVVDPIGLAPIFAAITQGGTREYRRRMAVRGTVIAGVILFVFALVGAELLRALGIGMPAFQIAGGILLFLVAIDMVFARHSGIRSTTEREQREAELKADVSVFPLAFPLIAGPGALTTVLLMAGRYAEAPRLVLLVLAVVVIVLLLVLAALLQAERIMRWIGETGTNVITRVFGVVLAALAVQYVLDGLRAGFA